MDNRPDLKATVRELSKLIIEIDGTIHDNQKEYDSLRTYILNNLGYKIIRFRNEDILNDINKVIKELESYL